MSKKDRQPYEAMVEANKQAAKIALARHPMPPKKKARTKKERYVPASAVRELLALLRTDLKDLKRELKACEDEIRRSLKGVDAFSSLEQRVLDFRLQESGIYDTEIFIDDLERLLASSEAPTS